MRRSKVITIIFLIIISISLVTCFCAGCDFIQYVEKSENQVVSDEVKVLQDEYVDKLYSVTSEINYRENEQKLYEYALQDAVNELYECHSEIELKQVYEKHLIVIGKIKTDDEYSTEEEANAISAYRVAILGQAEESYEKQKYTEGQITYLDTVFTAFSGELFETTDREEMKGLLQEFYFDVHKEDEILSLINYVDISIYEEPQRDILVNVLSKCMEDIRNCDNEEDISNVKAAYEFEVYKRETVKKLNNYIDLKLYREEQAKEITRILEEHLGLVEEVLTSIQADNIYREYQIAVYNIPTDEMLYNEEIEALKQELNSTLVNTYKLSLYRENEGQTVRELLSTFQELLETIKKKEDVLSQYIIVKSRLDSVKTAKVLDEEDRVNLIEELYIQIQEEIDKNIDKNEQAEYLAKAELVYSAMKDRVSLEGIRLEYRQFVQEIAGATIGYLRNELIEYKDNVLYRVTEQSQVNAFKEEYLAKLTDDISIEYAKMILREAQDLIDKIKTNDDLWDDSLTQFRSDLIVLYGNAILEEPRSLTEANDYFELASIIDYYAFYQISYTEFLCDEFRVFLNYDHKWAQWEINEVYWYSELVPCSIGITGYLEDTHYLVIRLVPYALATKSNKEITEYVTKYESNVEYNSDKSKMQKREVTFENFAYLNCDKSIIGVWNTQQLWFALEHEYIPVCVSDSIAEMILNKAENILRNIILEGMTEEEKIFQIYSWFAGNVQFDELYTNYWGASDLVNFPDEQVATLNSFYLEGVFDDGLAVCVGYAKAYLLLLRMEGIESFRIFVKQNTLIGINTLSPVRTLNWNSYGRHQYVLIKMSDGKYYYSDVQQSYVLGQVELQTYHQMLVHPSMMVLQHYVYVNPNIEYGEDINKIYKNLRVGNISNYVSDLEHLKILIDNLDILSNEQMQISIFCDKIKYPSVKEDLINLLSGYNYYERSYTNAGVNLCEYIIYN